jgi:DNA-binding GntR family transcriptional regulator
MLKPIGRRRSLASDVLELLRAAIMNGEFALGEALSEESLASKLQVSRTPVREALNMLNFQGLVTIVPQKGTFVFCPSTQDVTDLCELRATLELKAVELALERAPEATATELKTAVESMAQAQVDADPAAYARADNQFHTAFLTHCGNNYIAAAYVLVSGQVAALRAHLAAHVSGEPARSFAEHKELIDVWEKRDIGRVREILTNHIMRTLENYLKAVKSGALPPSAQTLGARLPPGSSMRGFNEA